MFVSGVDDTLLSRNNELGAYSKWELNRMLDEGAKFTLSTMRTPASIMEYLYDIRLKLPVICMDGAALYDIRENRYLRKITIEEDKAEKLCQWLGEEGFHVFVNRIVEDACIIHYGSFNNHPEADIYEKMRRSPYRNYIGREPGRYTDVVYLMLIDTTQRIDRLYEKMTAVGMTGQYKILKYPSRDYEGYSYIKIYHLDANRENMMQYLADMLQVVKVLRKLYEPVSLRCS